MKRSCSRPGVVALLAGIFFLICLLFWGTGLAPQWSRGVLAAWENPSAATVAATGKARRDALSEATPALPATPESDGADAKAAPPAPDAARAFVTQPAQIAAPRPADAAQSSDQAAANRAAAGQTRVDQAAPDNPAAVRPQSAGPPQSRADAVASLPAVDQESSPAAPAKPSAPPHTTLRLFGTVEFRRPLSSLPGWLELLKRNAQHGIFTPGQVLKKGVTWAQFRAGAAGKKGVSLLRYVNAFWNAWPYREDRDVWGREDYWAIPQEFLRRSGDCEDYAIIKYFTLKELGLSPKTMRIVVVRDTVRNLGHAVLAVYMDGTAYILDNLSNAILPHDRLRQYRPQYSVNEQGRWAHLQVSRVP